MAEEEYLILDAAHYPLEKLLSDHPPRKAILARARDLKWAGRAARAGLVQADQVLVRTVSPVIPGAFSGPGLVLHYDLGRETAYVYRYLCGNYPHCENPAGPWMHYCNQRKSGDREGPQFCAACRRAHPSDRNRAAMTALNRKRRKHPE